MLSFVVISFVLLEINAQNYCLFGRSGLNSVVNGLYIDTGSTYNSEPTYVKNIDSSCDTYYIYFESSQWRISDAPGAPGYYGYCPTNDLSSCTKGKWLIADGGFIVDSNMFITADSCPEWSCSSITTTIPTIYDDLCKGPFTKAASNENAWVNADSNGYLWYHPTYAEWMCGTSVDLTCEPSLLAITENYIWTTLSQGTYDDVYWKYYDTTIGSWEYDTYRMNCLANTSSPTATTVTPTKQSTTSSSSGTGDGDSWCIWGRSDSNGVNVGLNGLYEYDGDQYGHASYKKTSDSSCSQSTLYLYINADNTEWRIGSVNGASNYYTAWCHYADVSSCTAGRWIVASGVSGNIYDPNMHAQASSCPSWNCASITSSVSTPMCSSFTEHVGVNTWKNSAGYYWHFLPEMWMWRCIDSNSQTIESCTSSYYAATDQSQGWVALSAGESASLLYSSGSGIYTVSCSIFTASPTSHTYTGSPTGVTSAPTTYSLTTHSPTTHPPTTHSPTTQTPTTKSPTPITNTPTISNAPSVSLDSPPSVSTTTNEAASSLPSILPTAEFVDEGGAVQWSVSIIFMVIGIMLLFL